MKETDGKRAKRLRQAIQKAADAETKRLAPKPVKTDEDEEGEKPKKKDKAPQGGGGGGKSAGGGKPSGGSQALSLPQKVENLATRLRRSKNKASCYAFR